jgi:NRPS condensation-like uncharacterized protein
MDKEHGGGMVQIPPRSVRIPAPIWNAAKARAEREGTTVTAVILRALTRYAKKEPTTEEKS